MTNETPTSKTTNNTEENIARLYLGNETWHDGAGWYFVDDEYPEEGSCGAFPTMEEAKQSAESNGYTATRIATHNPAKNKTS